MQSGAMKNWVLKQFAPSVNSKLSLRRLKSTFLHVRRSIILEILSERNKFSLLNAGGLNIFFYGFFILTAIKSPFKIVFNSTNPK